MMAVYKVDHFFALQGQGWGETYYMQAADPAAMYQAQLPLLYARSKLLAFDCEVRAIRISDVNIQRDSQLAVPPTTFRFTNTVPADRVGMARRIRFESNSVYWRHLMMRGVPDSIFDETPGGNGDQVEFRARLLDYFQCVLGRAPYTAANQVYIFALTKPAPPEIKVVAWLPSPTPGVQRITATGNLGVVTGDHVKLYLLRGAEPPVSRLVVLGTPAANQIDVAYTPVVPGILSPNAYVRALVYAARPVTFATDEGATHRNTGRPFGLQRGRRSR